MDYYLLHYFYLLLATSLLIILWVPVFVFAEVGSIALSTIIDWVVQLVHISWQHEITGRYCYDCYSCLIIASYCPVNLKCHMHS
jgi:hypothetical protein